MKKIKNYRIFQFLSSITSMIRMADQFKIQYKKDYKGKKILKSKDLKLSIWNFTFLEDFNNPQQKNVQKNSENEHL